MQTPEIGAVYATRDSHKVAKVTAILSAQVVAVEYYKKENYENVQNGKKEPLIKISSGRGLNDILGRKISK